MTRRLLAFIGLVAANAGAGAPPLRVVTLSTVLTEIAGRVGGPDASVTGLVHPGVDPHTFEPSPDDFRELAAADVVLAGGLGLESYLDKLAANSGTRAKVVEVGSFLGPITPFVEERGRREPDPHWWNSIAAMIRVTQGVCAELSLLRPASAEAFDGRARIYLQELEALDRWARGEISELAPERRQLVTNHDAFGWFARDYGFTVHPVNGLSPDAEPNARDFAGLIDLVRKEHIPALFVENSASSALAEALAHESGARLGGVLYADGLSPDADGATYAAMFRHNVRTILAALK